MDAPSDRPNYTRLKFQFSIVCPSEPSVEKYPDLNLTVSMKTLSFFFLSHLGLCLLLHGQLATLSDGKAVKKRRAHRDQKTFLVRAMVTILGCRSILVA